LISTTALEEFGRKIGLGVSERSIGAVIGGIPAFQVGGKFDEATFRRILTEQRLSDRELRDGIRGDLLRRQLLTPVTTGLGVPADMAKPYAQLLVDIHRGGVTLVPAAATAPPTEALPNSSKPPRLPVRRQVRRSG
jgi:peptidyl-prolyl cis-trans isomerase D